jgi:hypothetical protein
MRTIRPEKKKNNRKTKKCDGKSFRGANYNVLYKNNEKIKLFCLCAKKLKINAQTEMLGHSFIISHE